MIQCHENHHQPAQEIDGFDPIVFHIGFVSVHYTLAVKILTSFHNGYILHQLYGRASKMATGRLGRDTQQR